MAKFYLLSVVFLVSISLPACSQDLVGYEELTFNSELEKKVFSELHNANSTDYFLLLMAQGSLLTDTKVLESQSRFYEFIDKYKLDQKFAARKSDKKTKQIYDDVHNTYFKKFVHGSTFEEIFYNGNFNSLTASAVYALVFDRIGIPYAIKEEEAQVYLVAYPNNERIKIESTTPITEIRTLSQEAKAQYVKSLKDQKLISPHEYSSASTDKLFDKYFYSQENITLANLAGILYMQNAASMAEARKPDEAASQMEKAYYLFPSNRNAYLLMVYQSQAYDARPQRDSIHATMFRKLTKFYGTALTLDVLTSQFDQTMNTLLFQQGKKEEAAAYYAIATRGLDHYALLSELKYIYYYETGRFFYNQGRFRDATANFEIAVKEKPQNVDVVNIFINSMAKSSARESGPELIQKLERYGVDIPTLKDNAMFNSFLANAYLLQCGSEYEQNRVQQGDIYRTKFEDLYKSSPDITINEQLVGYTYSQIAVYFYRKSQNAKAKAIIDTGLKISPNNHELLSRKQMIR